LALLMASIILGSSLGIRGSIAILMVGWDQNFRGTNMST
jgi:hypothetical protein